MSTKCQCLLSRNTSRMALTGQKWSLKTIKIVSISLKRFVAYSATDLYAFIAGLFCGHNPSSVASESELAAFHKI